MGFRVFQVLLPHTPSVNTNISQLRSAVQRYNAGGGLSSDQFKVVLLLPRHRPHDSLLLLQGPPHHILPPAWETPPKLRQTAESLRLPQLVREFCDTARVTSSETSHAVWHCLPG